MSTGLLKDSLTRLGKISREIVGISKNIFTYQKEKYKYDIRINLIETLGISR